jgi:hypothetical protein
MPYTCIVHWQLEALYSQHHARHVHVHLDGVTGASVFLSLVLRVNRRSTRHPTAAITMLLRHTVCTHYSTASNAVSPAVSYRCNTTGVPAVAVRNALFNQCGYTLICTAAQATPSTTESPAVCQAHPRLYAVTLKVPVSPYS